MTLPKTMAWRIDASVNVPVSEPILHKSARKSVAGSCGVFHLLERKRWRAEHLLPVEQQDAVFSTLDDEMLRAFGQIVLATCTRLESCPKSLASPSLMIKMSTLSRNAPRAPRAFLRSQKFISIAGTTTDGRST